MYSHIPEQSNINYKNQLTDDVKANIENNIVYHGSRNDCVKLLGSKTRESTGETGGVFVTPFPALAYCFIIDTQYILDKITPKGMRYQGINFGFDIWNFPPDQLREIPKTITVELNVNDNINLSGTAEGYLYSIDYSQYANKAHMFNQNQNSDVEFVISGDVDYIKKETIIVNWTCKSDKESIDHHGLAKLISNKKKRLL